MTFLWEITKNAYKFSDKEDVAVRYWLNILIRECPKTCSFLLELPLNEMEFYWAPGMTLESGIMGAWCITTPKRIYLREVWDKASLSIHAVNRCKSGIIKDPVLNMKFSNVTETNMTITLIHELIHRLQFQAAPVSYIANRLVTLFVDRVPFLEQIGIEYDARKNSETEELKNFTKDFTNCFSSYWSAVMPKDYENCWLYKNWKYGTDTDGNPIYSERMKQLVIDFTNLINM